MLTAGNWNADDPPLYFLAGSPMDCVRDDMVGCSHVLIAINEITRPIHYEIVQTVLDRGQKILIDSGIYWLTNEHMRAHGCTMNEALALPPEQIDRFDWLLNHYRAVVEVFGAKSWGYIELDQGGRDHKRRLREQMEAEGLAPIPVYHPLHDGWDYFDELAQRYDRICIGNMVQSDVETRKRLIATMWERRRRYPRLWIHLLGLTPNTAYYAFPLNSCDSSSWLRLARWPGNNRANVMGDWHFENDVFWFDQAATDFRTSSVRARRLGCYEHELVGRNLRRYFADAERALGVAR